MNSDDIKLWCVISESKQLWDGLLYVARTKEKCQEWVKSNYPQYSFGTLLEFVHSCGIAQGYIIPRSSDSLHWHETLAMWSGD